MVLKEPLRKKQYRRIRGDTFQQKRIIAVALIFGMLAFMPVSVQLYRLMINQYDRYSQLALDNQTRMTQVGADRGYIYDRNMNILAASKTVENIYLDPQELRQSDADIDAISAVLGQILEKDPQWIRQQATDLTMRYKQIAARVDNEVADQVRDYINENNISGIHLEPDSQRYYPYGTLASQVIGFTNSSNTGCEGIEAAYNSFLEGTAGKVITTKGNNEMDMPYSYEDYLMYRQGNSVVLTIDTTVQSCLEKQMETAIAKYDVQNGAFGLVMNAKTGEILAMATIGGYDPNNYQDIADPQALAECEALRQSYLQYQPDTTEYEAGKKAYEEAVNNARLKQWRNRCISDGYEPGSTFKVITMAAALDCGAITLDTDFSCTGSEHIAGRSQLLHCWRSKGHGAQKTPQALQNSCNLAFAHIALKLGGERFYQYVTDFGILEKTGIDLAGESKGVFFDKSVVVDTDKWGTASLTSGSFGQTFKLTPLQLVRGIAAVVNGGYLLEPYVVSEVIDPEGNTVLKQEPTVLRQVISNETSATMCQLLQSVVEEGTAKNAAVAGYLIGGKTGTSEKIDVLDENGQRTLDKIVSFVGVAPMDDPEYIVLVALDTPSRTTGLYISGGVMAAPTVGGVLGDILPYLGVKQSYTQDDAAGRTIVLEDLTGLTMAEAQKKLKDSGLEAVFRGEGEQVVSQIPGAGQSVSGDSQVILYLEESPTQEMVTVPDFYGMNRQQASDAAGMLGLNILVSGNSGVAPEIIVVVQSEPKGKKVPVGTTIRLEFVDTKVAD